MPISHKRRVAMLTALALLLFAGTGLTTPSSGSPPPPPAAGR
jgi:hypothetical protein